MTAVVSSLVQICLDEHFRTQQGFLSLIEKEWMAISHPFCTRLFKLSQSPSEMAPVFLLFLDCVAQILAQNPVDFEFSSHFLIAIWDSILTGFCQNFCADSMKNRLAFRQNLAKVPNLSELNRFFSADYRILFFNPKYWRFVESFDLEGQKFLSTRKRAILRPVSSETALNFFADFFLRWSSPSHTESGGSIQAHLLELRALGEAFEYSKRLKKLPNSTFAAKLAEFLSDSLNFCERFEFLINSGFPYCSDVTPSPEQSYSGPALIVTAKERNRQSVASFTSWVEVESDEKGPSLMNRSYAVEMDDDTGEQLELHESKSDVHLRRLEVQKLNTLV